MKTAARILIILLAAAVVTAGLLAFANSSLAANLRSSLPGRDGFERMPFSDAQRFPGGDASLRAGRDGFPGGDASLRAGRDGFPGGRGERDSQAGSLFGLIEVVKNLGLMALVVLIVASGAYLLRRLRRRNPPVTQAPGLP